jgi:hypothetical protein
MDVPKEVEELSNDLIWAKNYVNQYKKLFLYNQKRRDLLNDVARSFFRNLQRMYWDEMTISVARLMDPHMQKGNKNLALDLLTKLAEENGWGCEREVSDLIEKAREKAKPVISRRMKLTAHRDLPTAMKKVVLKKVGIAEIEEALSLAGQALNIIYLKIAGKELSWDFVSGHDVDALVNYLKLAVAYKELSTREQDWVKDNELRRNSKYYEA